MIEMIQANKRKKINKLKFSNIKKQIDSNEKKNLQKYKNTDRT